MIPRKYARTFELHAKMLYTVFITLFSHFISVKLLWRCSESCFIAVMSYTHLMFAGLLAPQWMSRTSRIWEKKKVPPSQTNPVKSRPSDPKLFLAGGLALDVAVSYYPYDWIETELNWSRKFKWSTSASLRATKHHILLTQSFIFLCLSSPKNL